jgi:localization factor PodJL
MRPEAIETAREAARRAGLPLSEWIDTAIERAADAGIDANARPVRDEQSAGAGAGYAKVNDRLDDIAARLDRLAARADAPRAASAAAEARSDLDPAARDLESRLAGMARDLAPRRESTPRRLADAIGRLDQRLDQMIADRQPPDAPDRGAARTPAPGARSFALDEAIAEISARQRALDEEPDGPVPAADLSGIEHLLHNITGQIETLRRPCGAEDAVAALRDELGEIGRSLADATPQRTLDAMQSELRALSERIDQGLSGGEPALAGIERGLDEVRDALTTLAPAERHAGLDDEMKALSRRVDLLASTGPDADAREHLETAIAELRNISARVASGDALAALASDVRTIGAKVDRVAQTDAPDHDGTDHLVRRIDALAAALEGHPRADGPGDTTQVEALIRRLTDKLETVETVAGRHGFEQLEGQLARLTEKLDATDARLGNLGAIEHAIADLMERLHDARASALDAAEQAARAAVREAMAGGTGPEVDALKHELADFRSTQADIDRRTQDMLEGLHGTLERLVDRLTAIETDSHALPMAGAGGTAAAPAPLVVPSLSRPPAQAARPAGERRSISPGLPADHPLEPGTGAPRTRGPATPAERIAASEAVLPPTKSTTAEPAGKANFIAAARRAAQAAAADASSDGLRTPDDKARGSLLGTLRGAVDKHRRPLMIGIGVLLLALGTLQLVTNMMAPGEPVRPAPSETTGAREGAPSGPGAPMNLAPARPAEAPPAPERQSENAPNPAAANPPAPRTAGQAAPIESKAPFVPPFPSLPGFTEARPPADVTGSTVRAPETAAVAPAAVPPPTAAQPAAPQAPVGPGLRSAALAGNPAAEYELALRYAEGRGVTASAEQAVHWFERAANHGLAPAQYRLGSIYEKGQGVKKDLEAARRLYIAAAEKGNGKAMHNLAVLYAEGLNGDPDYRNASQWFRKAADHGVADSQYNLGILYARGIGVEQNLAESYKWFALAAQQGDQDAGKKRDDVASRLDAQSLVAARLAVQTWTADPQPAEAVDVKAPAGGWEKPAAASHPPKVKPAVGPPRKLTTT